MPRRSRSEKKKVLSPEEITKIKEIRCQLNKKKKDAHRERLKQIAIDILSGQIFTDRHIRSYDKHLMNMVFMVLTFMKPHALDEFIKKIGKEGIIYEQMSKAGPRAINGYPIFMSVSYLGTRDANIVWRKVKKYQETMASLK